MGRVTKADRAPATALLERMVWRTVAFHVTDPVEYASGRLTTSLPARRLIKRIPGLLDMTSHYYLDGARQRMGYLSLAFVLLWPPRTASAQQTGTTTIGALMAAAVDSLQLAYSAGGPGGGESADLVLGRTKSAFVGLLKYYSRRHTVPQVGQPREREACDTSMVATMSLADADRFLRSLDTIRVEVGGPQAQPRVTYDYDRSSALRLWLPSGPLVMRDARGVEHAGTVYHVPTTPAPPRKPGVLFWLGPEDAPALRRAQDSLFVHLRLEEMRMWARRCFGEIQ